MPKRIVTLIMSLVSLFICLNLTACSRWLTSQPTVNSIPMSTIYHDAINGEQKPHTARHKLRDIRHQLNHEVVLDKAIPRQHQQAQLAWPTTSLGYHRLQNPTIDLFVYPHWLGNASNRVLIPGYTTQFPLYVRVLYDKNKY